MYFWIRTIIDFVMFFVGFQLLANKPNPFIIIGVLFVFAMWNYFDGFYNGSKV